MARTPIVLGPHAVAVVHIFTRKDFFEDMWMLDYISDPLQDIKESAKQFIDQLEGNECIAFLDALREECERIVNDHRNQKEGDITLTRPNT